MAAQRRAGQRIRIVSTHRLSSGKSMTSATSNRTARSDINGRSDETGTNATPHAQSYYAATANPPPERPALDGHADTEVCVIGAGVSGVSTALSRSEPGKRGTALQ